MISFDTNLLVYAANLDAPECPAARQFLEKMAAREDVVVCELMLVEAYLKLRNAHIMTHPFNASEAAAFCQTFRTHPRWMLVESAPVMNALWRQCAHKNFAIRRIIDARLALTLRHYGVTEFATANGKDFGDFGFTRVWNPLTHE